jgi:hypothetical protein
MPDDRKRDDAKREASKEQDEAVRETFPASDPPASMASGTARAVPASELFEAGQSVPGAVTLRRRFPDADAAKLALESLVREGPVDRDATEIHDAELRLAVPPEDAERIRGLLQRA